MTCLCAQSAQEGTELSPVCLGQLWIFNDLTPAEREFLAVRAKRQQNERGRIIFSQDVSVEKRPGQADPAV
jgi:CRP/FNR family transcriptional regulator